MAWHSTPDRLDEPRACCFDGLGAKGMPLVDGAHGAEIPDRISRGVACSPTRAAKPAVRHAKTERWPSG
ncbi:hypothetical protein MESS2_1570015 [Mesorhizobium metallidurans STM 2683]|uniref:Uncharacterized protein n=1 Tax=Mesorhizobium metallidurans STM 2683 TaxID=1297569 RepID=M5EMN2_9HYPH|nr:hypothetical protein MESS2_1570015 [Mesorhizobium metallidurans STM 2683]